MEKRIASANSVKEGSFILIDDTPCKVVSVTKSKTGKHGHAKVRIEGLSLIDGRRKTLVVPSDDKVEVPILEKKNAQVLSLEGDVAQVMDLQTYETFEAEIDESVKDRVEEGKQVVYWDLGEIKRIIEVRKD